MINPVFIWDAADPALWHSYKGQSDLCQTPCPIDQHYVVYHDHHPNDEDGIVNFDFLETQRVTEKKLNLAFHRDKYYVHIQALPDFHKVTFLIFTQAQEHFFNVISNQELGIPNHPNPIPISFYIGFRVNFLLQSNEKNRILDFTKRYFAQSIGSFASQPKDIAHIIVDYFCTPEDIVPKVLLKTIHKILAIAKDNRLENIRELGTLPFQLQFCDAYVLAKQASFEDMANSDISTLNLGNNYLWNANLGPWFSPEILSIDSELTQSGGTLFDSFIDDTINLEMANISQAHPPQQIMPLFSLPQGQLDAPLNVTVTQQGTIVSYFVGFFRWLWERLSWMFQVN